MKIQYLPEFDQGEVTHVHSVALENRIPGISIWMPGEIKDIADDLKFGMTIAGTYYSTPLVHDLLVDRAFKAVDEDGNAANPNFVCTLCGGEAIEDALMHPKSGVPLHLEIHGKRVCSACFDAAPKTLTPTGYDFPPEVNDNA